MRRRLVDQVDRLIGQEAVGDIAFREPRRGVEHRVGNGDVMIVFVVRTDRAEHLHGILDRRFADDHGLEAALEGAVLLNKLAVLLHGRRADHLDLSARQGGF